MHAMSASMLKDMANAPYTQRRENTIVEMIADANEEHSGVGFRDA